MGIRRENHTGRSVVRNVHSHAAVVLGVRGAPRNIRGRFVVILLVPKLLQFVAPSVVTPICVFDAAPRAVRYPFPVRHSWRGGKVDLVTRSWSIECDLQECNSVMRIH